MSGRECPIRTLPDLLQQVADSIGPHRDDQKMGLLDGAMQVRLNLNIVLAFELAQLVRVAIMHDDGLPESCQAQAGQQRTGDASSTQKDNGIFSHGFHSRPAQARSAASISVATSFSVCAVEMIQCRPLDGVM